MADNRVAYGLAKKYGIDTTGKTPKEVWELLKEKGVNEDNIKDGAYDSKDDKAKELKKFFDNDGEDKPKEKKYNHKLDSAVMNKYSTVRKKVEKYGYEYTYVNDGNSAYFIKINKSNDDFDYDIIIGEDND